MDDFFGNVVMRSRMVKSMFVASKLTLRDPHSEALTAWVKKFPWSKLVPRKSSTPEFVVDVQRQAKYNPSRLVMASINEVLSDRIQSAASMERGVESHPRISVTVTEDTLEVGVEASGNGFSDFGYATVQHKSRLNIDSILATSVVAGCVVPRLVTTNSREICIWDPFCGSGALVRAVVSIVSGIPPGSPAIRYSFRNFPCHQSDVFSSVAHNLDVHPLQCAARVSVLGTDSSQAAIDISQTNGTRFMTTLPQQTQGGSLSSVLAKVQYKRLVDAYVPPPSDSGLYIVTALPASHDAEKKYRHFHEMLDTLITQNRLIGCSVYTSKSRLFRSSSKQRWLLKHRLFDSRRNIELLDLVI